MMKNYAALIFVFLGLNTQADLLLEQTPSYIKGKNCIQQNYAKSEYDDFDKLYEKVSCVEKIEITESGDILNLNCPQDPLFEDYFTNGKKHSWNNNCLRSDRNSNLKRYENVNCSCVVEGLKNKHKEDFQKNIDQFKKDLTKKALGNIGNRLLTKIDQVKKTDNAVSALNPQSHCFNENTNKVLKQILASRSCSSGLKERIQSAFGEGLNIKLGENETEKDAIEKLVQGLNGTNELQGKENQNGCFKDSNEFSKRYNAWSTHTGIVKLSPLFDEFIKDATSDKNPTPWQLKKDFNRYIKEKNIDLHPTIQALINNHPRNFFRDIQNRGENINTLEDFLNDNDGRWRKNSVHTVNKMCAYVITDLRNTLCPSANFAFDDPSFIDMIYTDKNKEKNEKNKQELLDKDLELKALYCENKELHSIDSKAKSLSIKAIYKGRKSSSIKTRRLTDQDFHGAINSLESGKREASQKVIDNLFKKSFEGKNLPKDVENHRKLGIVKHFMDAMLVDGKLFKEKAN